MDQTFDLPDSTDWLATPLSGLAPLESALRCQVCKDFFNNPVITSCSHTFCSLCIRRCLSAEGKCPACRASDQELKLRPNWAVQELVETFQSARPSVLQLARQAEARNSEDLEQPASKKRKMEVSEELTDDMSVDGVRTRSQARGGSTPQGPPAAEVIEVIDDSQDEEFVPADGLVACPICQRKMKNEAVFSHLDKCTGEPSPPKFSPKSSYGSLQMQIPARYPYRTKSKTLERLPTMNYSLYKESMLRKKLKDLGIPNTGPRPLLQKRHTEWVNLWNANCDSKSPKPHGVLLRELDVWERTQGNQSSSATEAPGSIMRKDFDKAAWSTSHEDDFKRLIADARKKSGAAVHTAKPQESPVSSTLQNTSVSEPTDASVSVETTNPSETMPVDASMSGAGAPETSVPPDLNHGQMTELHQ
ncbi:E3 ubiquitin-protein ligase RAD18 [Aspergillus homomorphus CBS 101889]|uniref:Postreplication repair E3 ubiquitin-protein ligase RAD18 n=1 Tax=Aspergillus homomorphus (strain CBS 101889) TaxID=1450537 RepID=A0A395I6X2_ASPHC|nr:DNA repair protein rad18 [Aspergillus homomorphus CBS 101889]RAL14848.1 DNA repair protein rad18 [Aspergillus homomorphus CBS 101889]